MAQEIKAGMDLAFSSDHHLFSSPLRAYYRPFADTVGLPQSSSLARRINLAHETYHYLLMHNTILGWQITEMEYASIGSFLPLLFAFPLLKNSPYSLCDRPERWVDDKRISEGIHEYVTRVLDFERAKSETLKMMKYASELGALFYETETDYVTEAVRSNGVSYDDWIEFHDKILEDSLNSRLKETRAKKHTQYSEIEYLQVCCGSLEMGKSIAHKFSRKNVWLAVLVSLNFEIEENLSPLDRIISIASAPNSEIPDKANGMDGFLQFLSDHFRWSDPFENLRKYKRFALDRFEKSIAERNSVNIEDVQKQLAEIRVGKPTPDQFAEVINGMTSLLGVFLLSKQDLKSLVREELASGKLYGTEEYTKYLPTLLFYESLSELRNSCLHTPLSRVQRTSCLNICKEFPESMNLCVFALIGRCSRSKNRN